ncbi:hypothetical protein [Oerskovia flava]|nr:hypothetical protein [Oerskovia sp. JB1-3-2]
MTEGTRQWRSATMHVRALLDELDPYGLEPGLPGPGTSEGGGSQ